MWCEDDKMTPRLPRHSRPSASALRKQAYRTTSDKSPPRFVFLGGNNFDYLLFGAAERWVSKTARIGSKAGVSWLWRWGDSCDGPMRGLGLGTG